MNEPLHKIAHSISLSQSETIADETLAIRQKHELLPLTVVVLDAGGQVVTAKREDGCGTLRFDIALGKAAAALGMGMSTRLIRDRLANRPAFQGALANAAQGRFIPVPGGVLILNESGAAIGAVGVSGDTSDKDEFCAINAVHVAGLASEPEQPNPDWNKSQL